MPIRNYATAQDVGLRANQCDATAVSTTPAGVRAYVLLDGIGESEAVRSWVRDAARRLARAAARRGDAEAGLRAVYTAYATERADGSPYARPPKAAAVVAVTAPGKPLTVAWCGDSRAYVLTPRGTVECLTNDHNVRRVFGGSRNVITSCLGSSLGDDEVKERYGHPAIESITRGMEPCRLLLTSDGAYEPHEDAGQLLADHLVGAPGQVARVLTATAVQRSLAATGSQPYADNATALVADLLP
ncbi:PP2C family protein-serine/threonine phosphatase [Kitasatospora sp. NPDC088346]|uniref:PP2C family protein-serine/threonine phosphatase n=1 Tax=Kitasatospora sp. NPDC088346 TaxID=3364073 RepID=UPI003821D7A8